ncbi:MAG: hypothetical protein JXR03_17120 [Cyclobacteriaceae bacterium]
MMRYIRYFSSLIFVVFIHTLVSSQSQRIVNDGWEFQKKGSIWENMNIPHTWNIDDPFDDEKGYHRGEASYRKKLHFTEAQIGRTFFLKFEAVNQSAQVYINDKLAGSHKGGYTAFYVDISSFIKSGSNELRVEVTNAHDPSIVPLKGDFNFYGGIYRDVWLEEENNTHFHKTKYGNDAVYLTPTSDGNTSALNIKGEIFQTQVNHKRLLVNIKMSDNQGKFFFETTQKITLKEAISSFDFDFNKLDGVELWSPDNPNLYQVKITLKDSKSNTILDSYSHAIGFRYFNFEADSGFYLNGSHLKLMGANRHQDFYGKGNALTDDYHRRDIRLLKEMGANFFRPAHYPQDASVLNDADRLGLIVTMEIPLDHDMTDSEDFRETTKQMMKEMIHQYYNHPSIVLWAHMNEMFLGRKLERDREKIDVIVDFAKELDKLTREEDPTRYTMIPNHGDFNVYFESGLTDIAQVTGWNLYYGWYEPDFIGFTDYLNNSHDHLPGKPTIITEYGAGADPRIRSLNPQRFDFSVDWQFQYHLSHLQQFETLPYVAGAAVWNLFDFGAEPRRDAVPHINNKGLMTYDRQPKDTYHLYKAWLTEEPFLEISPTLFPVLPKSHGQDTIYWPIRVITNQPNASIVVNNVKYDQKNIIDGFAEWQVPLLGNKLLVEAAAGEPSIKTMKTYDLSDALNINLGASYYFYDPNLDELWIPDQAFDKGKAFGHSNGTSFMPRDRGVGTDAPIALTELDPIFQTQNQGLTSYQFSVEEGRYELTMMIANIDNTAGIQEIYINDVLREVLDFNQMNAFSAIRKKYLIDAKSSIQIRLESPSGETVLNGLKLVKIN